MDFSRAVSLRTGTRGLRLLIENPRPQKLVREKLDSMRVVELDHPLYSPDLAPDDLWLFPKLNNTCQGGNWIVGLTLGSTILQYSI